MYLLFIATVILFVNGSPKCINEESDVVWIRQVYRTTHVNSCSTEDATWDILTHYYKKGYEISHHAMSDQIRWYGEGRQHYSWLLVKKRNDKERKDTL